jgi:rubrerythrin
MNVGKRDGVEAIRERNRSIKGIINMIVKSVGRIKNSSVRAWQMTKTVSSAYSLWALVDHTEGMDDVERNFMKAVILNKLQASPKAKEALRNIVEEYAKLVAGRRAPVEHRMKIIEHLDKIQPEDLKKLHETLKTINAAEKTHASILAEILAKHGVSAAHVVVKSYRKASPTEKEILVTLMKHAEKPEHVQRIEYHAKVLKRIREDVKQKIVPLIQQSSNFEEADSLIMAAHHADASIRQGRKKEEVLKSFNSKENALKRFGKPWRGWEPM